MVLIIITRLTLIRIHINQIQHPKTTTDIKATTIIAIIIMAVVVVWKIIWEAVVAIVTTSILTNLIIIVTITHIVVGNSNIMIIMVVIIVLAISPIILVISTTMVCGPKRLYKQISNIIHYFKISDTVLVVVSSCTRSSCSRTSDCSLLKQ